MNGPAILVATKRALASGASQPVHLRRGDIASVQGKVINLTFGVADRR